jgi:hypothetical protein
VILAGNVAVVYDMLSVEIVINRLSPLSDYVVYCVARSVFLVTTDYKTMIQSRSNVTTKCCKVIIVELMGSNYPEKSIQSNAILVYSDADPVSDLIVSFSLLNINVSVGYRRNDSVVYPSSLLLSSRNWNSIQPLSLYAVDSGVFTLSAALSGQAAHRFITKYQGSRTVMFLPRNIEPPTPFAILAAFSSDGLSATLSFDSPTDQAGLLNEYSCSKTLMFPGASHSTCLWESSTRLVIIPGGVTRLEPGHSISVNASNIRAMCVLDQASCRTWKVIACTIVVTAPSVVITPTVVISSPSVVGPCDTPLIDLLASSGSGGRMWKTIQVEVSSEDVDSALEIEAFFSAKYQPSPPTPIPQGLLKAGYYYGFHITLCNFLGGCSYSAVQMKIGDDNVPVVTLLGRNSKSVVASSVVLVQGVAFVKNCDGGYSYADLQYTWMVRKNGVQDGSIVSRTRDVSKFKLNPYSLVPLSVYEISLVVRSLSSGMSSSDKIYLTLGQSDLVASIAGLSSTCVRQGDIIRLDASCSYDPDRATSRHIGLIFAWTCFLLTASPSTI